MLPDVTHILFFKSLQITINAALGFDSFLVMRHGAGPTGAIRNSQAETSNSVSASMENLSISSQNGSQRLGCYFCNDVVAPIDVIFLHENDCIFLIAISTNMNVSFLCLCSQLPIVPWTNNVQLLVQGLLLLHQPWLLNFWLEFCIILLGKSLTIILIYMQIIFHPAF